MIQIFISKNGEFKKLPRIQDIEEQKNAGEFVWIAALSPTMEEQAAISQFLSIEPKSLEKILEKPPSGRYHRYFDFSALHAPIMVVEPFLHDEPFLILLNDHNVVTLGSHLPQEAISEVEGTLRNLVETGYTLTPSTVVVRIVQEIVELNATIIRNMISEALELGRHFAKVDITELLTEITRLRQHQGELYHHIMEQRSLVDMMYQHVPRHLKLDAQLTKVLTTIQTEVERQQQRLEFQSRSLNDLVSLHSTLLANRLNRVIIILTAITATVTLPSLIANIFGMIGLFHPDPLFFLFGSIPIFAWQLELSLLIPAFLIPLIWVIRKGWIRISFPQEKTEKK
jgi:Mg2+ and Co2+ transporter CorA